MRTTLFRWQGMMRLGALAAALCGALVASGCGSDDVDLERGRALFIAKCGTCHALAEAGQTAQVGPNLDAAFADARASGMDSDTIEGVVSRQIDNPREVDEADPDYQRVYMPPDLVTGQDAKDVAAYVASVAGVPGAEPPELTAEELFTERCGACHALDAAGTSGTTGPDLDQALRGQKAAQIRRSIVDPNAEITPGFQANVMPADFEQSLTPEQLDSLVELLVGSAGGGQGGGSGQGS